MSRHTVFAGLVLALTAGLPALSQENPSRDTVLATVGATKITLGHAIALRAALPQDYSQIEPGTLFEGIVRQLVDQTLLMQSLEEDPSAGAQLRLDNERRAILAADAIRGIVGSAVTEEAIAARYEADYADAEPQDEYRASHILVKTEDEAADIRRRIDEGANFAGLAQEHSIGPSGPSGGSLGWFGEGVMVQSFFDAVATLAVGEVSDPVETQFGWHVIKLDETRIRDRPALGEVRTGIADALRAAAIDARLATLEAATDVDRSGAAELDPEVINRFDLLGD